MAGFHMHVTTSSVLGCGYAGVLSLGYHVPLDTSIVAGAMCGFSGMLPDLDSDYGVPLRETMAFTAAIVPMFLVGHFETLRLSHDQMLLAAVTLYLFVRFAVTNLIRKYTVHRGMFHSIPAMLTFAGLAFLAAATSPFDVRCIKAGGVAAGFMSHLVLDEIYSVEWKGGRWRLKKSSGTAIKFWGDDAWANLTCYAKLAVVAMLVLGEPAVIASVGDRYPQFAAELDKMRGGVSTIGSSQLPQNLINAAHNAAAPLTSGSQPFQASSQPPASYPPAQPYAPQTPSPGPFQPQRITWPSQGNPGPGNNVNTAERPSNFFPQ